MVEDQGQLELKVALRSLFYDEIIFYSDKENFVSNQLREEFVFLNEVGIILEHSEKSLKDLINDLHNEISAKKWTICMNELLKAP